METVYFLKKKQDKPKEAAQLNPSIPEPQQTSKTPSESLKEPQESAPAPKQPEETPKEAEEAHKEPQETAEAPKEPERRIVPQNSHAAGEGLSRATCGEPAQFVLTTKDQHSQQFYTPETKVAAQVEREGQAVSVIVNDDTKDGTYNCTIALTVGLYYLTISVDDVQISEKPLVVQAHHGKVSPQHTQVHGQGVTTAVAKEPASFLVIPFDNYGNLIESVNRDELGLTGEISSAAHPDAPKTAVGIRETLQEVKQETSDTLRGFVSEYTVDTVGEYDLQVLCSGEPIKGNHFVVITCKASYNLVFIKY